MDPVPLPHSLAADRNRIAILAVLQRVLPSRGVAIEVASGTGQHAQHFAGGLPGWRWHPTEIEPQALATIAARCSGITNVHAPVLLDVMSPAWDAVPERADAVFCANLLHISPWPVTAALMRGAARHLVQHGRLVVYGPFFVDGEPAEQSNLDFDADLRQRNPEWGLRQVAEVMAEATAAGLQLREQTRMPANNRLLVFGRNLALHRRA